MSESKPSILITGATGNVGKELIKELAARNVAFRAMVRSPRASITSVEGAELINLRSRWPHKAWGAARLCDQTPGEVHKISQPAKRGDSGNALGRQRWMGPKVKVAERLILHKALSPV